MGRSGRFAAAIAFIIVILVASPQAQQPSYTGAPGAMAAGPAAPASSATSVDLLVGRSTILNVAAPISRVSLTVPDIADAMVTSPQQLLIHGKAPGTISLFVWDRAGGINTYEINVRRDLKELGEQMQQLFPGEPITVAGSGRDVVVSGTVSSKYVIDKAAAVAAGYVEKPENVVNLLKQQEGVASNQVMLRVRFAEVSRSALQQIGASLFTGPTGYKNIIARTTTQQFASPDFTNLTRTADSNNNLTSADGQYSLSDFLNLFVFSNKLNIGTVIRDLQQKGLFQSLAEPDLIASNGKEASFLAGGEYPYPVVQPSSSGNSVTIVFKEYGVRLSFTPTVLSGDLINLKVKPEVSSLDFSNALTLSGFTVPGLSTRRTETEVELENGQTFAIAGLLNNSVNSTMSKIPGIGDIPVLGYLFKSRAYQKNQTELVVMITPVIVRRGSTGVSAALPNIDEPYIGAPAKTMPQPAPWVGARPVVPSKSSGGKKEDDPAPQMNVGSVTPAASLPVNPPPSSAAQRMAVEPAAAKVAAAKPMVGTPVASVVPLPQAPVPHTQTVEAPAAAPATAAPPADTKSVTKADAKAQKKAAEEQKKADAKAAAEQKIADQKAVQAQKDAARQAAEAQREAEKKAAADKAQQAKVDADRARREAEDAKKAAEADKKKQEDDKKRDKAMADAAAKLKDAQSAYDKAKGSGEA